MGVMPPDALEGWAAIGELNLNGEIAPVSGALPAAVAAGAMGLGLICPQACGPEAAWAGETPILAPRSLFALVNHFRGSQVLSHPKPGPMLDGAAVPDLKDVKGQENAKQALEIAAAGGYNLLYVGPRPDPASPCWPSHCPAYCRRSRPANCWRPRWCIPSPVSSPAAP